MRGIAVLCVSLVVSPCFVLRSAAQVTLRYNPDKAIVCRHSQQNLECHVGVSENFKRSLRQGATGRIKTSTFEVEYVNFPDDNAAKTAFQHAVAIWESELISSVPIRIRAEWKDLGKGVVGEALWGSAYTNFGGEPYINTFYPVALAEKIAGTELNGANEPDIVASFNRNIPWYLKTDGNTPVGKMDFVTIVLHEMAHGLGFTDTYDVENQSGRVGLLSEGQFVPFVFDLFVTNDSDENLLHHFESPSTQLGSALQSTNVFFDGTQSVAALNGVPPELYAPPVFNSGSSISHLDETAFSGADNANRLMTPQIAFAESIHDPGEVARAMLSDMGWVFTRIVHTSLKDTERADGQPYPVEVVIDSDNGYDAGNVKLHYSIDGVDFTTVTMTPTGAPDEFQFSLPGVHSNWAYAYFISVEDAAHRTFTSPGKTVQPGQATEQSFHFFNIRPDIESPKITHRPLTWVSEDETALSVDAEVTDNVGVKEVLLEYFINAGPVHTMVMDNISLQDDYRAIVPLSDLKLGDKFEYRIIARDLAGTENVSHLPLEAYYPVLITGTMPVRDAYSNNFNTASFDFFGNDFSITRPPAFPDAAIHTNHPYTDETGTDKGQYTYQLQIPIRIGEVNPVITFDEIVLVEPGEPGSEFGGADFYDYVVVEGSVDGGVSWEPFAPGYDARDRSTWLSHYNSGLVSGNSDSQGTPTLYSERVINMLETGNFSVGDEVLIRFRLFADELSHGWGWAIDNLSIQEPLTPVVRETVTSKLNVYPIPVETDLFIELETPGDVFDIAVCDMQGKVVMRTGRLAMSNGNLRKGSMNVGSLRNGLYILKAFVGDKVYYRKFVKR